MTEHSRRATAPLVGACTVLLVACAPTADPTASPTPTPEPTFECTPIFSGDPSSCSQEDFDKLASERQRYDEAERIYTEMLARSETLLAEKRPMDDELRAMLTGDLLASRQSLLEDNVGSGTQYAGHSRIEWAHPINHSNLGSDLALEVCSSPGDFQISTDGVEYPSESILAEVFFVEEGGVLKVASSKAAAVDQC